MEQAELVEPVEEQVEVDPTEKEESQEAGAGQKEAEPAEMVISLGEEPVEEEQQRAPEWVRELRKSDREKAKRIRELEQQLQANAGQNSNGNDAPKKPTLSDEDINFDEDIYSQKMKAWLEHQRQIEDKAAQERKATEDAQAAWNAKVSAYNTAKAALPVADFDDAESAVLSHFDQVKQAIILNGADKPEQLIYALGKSPAKLKELSAITDPVKFAFSVAKLETQVKVTERKKPPAPEKVVQGSGGKGTAVDSTLDRLREEAQRTGDLSKVIAYKAQKRA